MIALWPIRLKKWNIRFAAWLAAKPSPAKFCSAACKNRWHNRKKNQHRGVVEQRVLRILERNHSILDKLERLGVRSVDRLTLVGLGYNPEYVTSYRKSGIHHQYACFDIHYEQTPTRIKKIVRTTIRSSADDLNV